MVPLLLDRGRGADRVADEHRLDESQAVVAVGHRARIDRARSHAHSDAEDERAVRHAALEVLGRAPHRVQMVREKVAGLAGVSDDVGFGDRAAERPAVLADLKVLEIAFLDFHQGWAFSGVAGFALDSKAASTSAIVVQASSTDATR